MATVAVGLASLLALLGVLVARFAGLGPAGQGAGWGEAMAGHAGLLPDLADLVTPMAGDRLVTCHRDLHTGNVLVAAAGELAVLDWDDAGPACPGP